MADKMALVQDFSLKTLLFPCHYHSTDVPYSYFIHRLSMPNNCSNWWHC